MAGLGRVDQASRRAARSGARAWRRGHTRPSTGLCRPSRAHRPRTAGAMCQYSNVRPSPAETFDALLLGPRSRRQCPTPPGTPASPSGAEMPTPKWNWKLPPPDSGAVGRWWSIERASRRVAEVAAHRVLPVEGLDRARCSFPSSPIAGGDGEGSGRDDAASSRTSVMRVVRLRWWRLCGHGRTLDPAAHRAPTGRLTSPPTTRSGAP